MSKQIPDFETKAELADWLIENKSALIAAKKAEVKRADAISVYSPLVDEKGETTKAEALPGDVGKIKVRSIINTTNLMDSHYDVHIPGLWKKSLQETKDHYLIREHEFEFKNILSDEVKAFTKTMTWKELGLDLPGTTQALVFDSVITRSELHKDVQFMFDRYKSGKVKNHSVGMRYVKIDMAINDDRYEKEKQFWDKYIEQVANREKAEEKGYFWVVTEAKIVEGSAVIRGSNWATPTQSVEETKDENEEAVADTSDTHKDEPPQGTQTVNKFINSNLY